MPEYSKNSITASQHPKLNSTAKPQNYKTAEAVASRYVALTYAYDPDLALEAAASAEQASVREAVQSLTVTQRLITCSRTGQPVGAMFSRAVSQHLPVSVAPTWMNTGKDRLNSLLTEQPIASLVYAISKLAFANGDWFTGTEFANESVIVHQERKHAALANLFIEIAAQSPQRVANMLSVVLEFNDWLQYAPSALAVSWKPLQAALRENKSGQCHIMESVITDAYARAICVAYVGASAPLRLSQTLALGDEPFLDECEQMLTRARHGALSRERHAIAEASRKHNQISADASAERRRSAKKRADDKVATAYERQFSASINDFFTHAGDMMFNTSAAAAATATAATVQPASQAPTSLGFNLFAVGGQK